MSYEIGPRHAGGYVYRITINGLIVMGWRQGTRAEVEEHVKKAELQSSMRASGRPNLMKNPDGSNRLYAVRGGRKRALETT